MGREFHNWVVTIEKALLLVEAYLTSFGKVDLEETSLDDVIAYIATCRRRYSFR